MAHSIRPWLVKWVSGTNGCSAPIGEFLFSPDRGNYYDYGRKPILEIPEVQGWSGLMEPGKAHIISLNSVNRDGR